MTQHSSAPPRTELTLRGLILGALITVVFTAANVFLGLKVGLTFASSIPAAVISMAILRGFKNSTIQENNIVQTVASAAGTLSSVIFVLPGLVIVGWWSGFPFWQAFGVCALGGILGVMYSIPLRRALVTNSDLPYPEGVAAAEVLQVGAGEKATDPASVAESKAGVAVITAGAIAAAGVALTKAMKLLVDEPARFFTAPWGGVTGVRPGFSLALMGVGHLVGVSVGFAMLVGLGIAWLWGVPHYSSLGPITDMAAAGGAAFREHVRYVGAGVIGTAAVWTLIKLVKPVAGGLASAITAQKRRGSGETLERTEQDIPIGIVGLISLLSLIPISVLLTGFVQGGALASLTVPLVAAALAYIVVIGLLVAAVVGYMAGLIGSSNSPLSGIGILAVVGAAGLLAVFVKPLVGDAASLTLIAFALFTTAVVFTVGTIANDNLQDLKTGQLVDATPWKQQVALIFGVLAGAVVIPPVLVVLGQAYGYAGVEGAGAHALPAPQANLIADLARGILRGDLPEVEMLTGVAIGAFIILVDELLGKAKLMRLPPLAVGLGIYLPMSSTLFVVIGAVIGRVFEGLVGNKPSGEISKRLGVLLASGLIVGESLFGVFNAGIVAAAQTGLLAGLGMAKDDPRAEAPLAPVFANTWVEGDQALFLTTGLFILLVFGLYAWTAAQGRKAAKAA
ncbi:oligopeptide transporter, OPT family [Caulobacter sp. 17J65-9]|uniref:OPT family oligopeptide transporter n=1 Tax=Caulobacter sp. 17J65-9 TaxID=2709382 RepID=UPI0013C65E6B|nr:oligopeptide transporter, OPT family [Caulobacter sp. 17J65-9]